MPVENYTTKIGKNILENLTSAMYTDSRFVYREYVQNAADAVDAAIKQNILTKESALIDIHIYNKDRMIVIEDNATGISKNEAGASLGNIADSLKDKNVHKGFRGIGRLGGLAYCNRLLFETSVKGENVKTIMTWDAKLLQDILNDPADRSDAINVIQRIVKLEEQPEDIEKHYFKVVLLDIKNSNDTLLNKDEIIEYLGQVAPVDFEKPKFQVLSDLKKYIEESGHVLDTYNVRINNENLYKIYTTKLMGADGKTRYDEISGIKTEEFYNDNNELLAWCWVGISKFDKRIPEKYNPQRGIRLKKSNIQLGDANTLNKLHKEQDRGNYYFVGEVHAVHKDLIPNARRDYFNENETLKIFENELREYFSSIYELYRCASDANSALKKQNDYVEKHKQYIEKSKTGNFTNKEEKLKLFKDVQDAKEKAEKAKKDLERIEKKTTENSALKRVVTAIKKEYKTDISPVNIEVPEVMEPEIENKKPKEGLRADKLNKLSRAERKLVSDIYAIIQKALDPETAENVIRKIEEKYT